MARRDMQAPWSLKAKYTPFLVTGMLLISVFMLTSLLVLNRPSPAAIRPATLNLQLHTRHRFSHTFFHVMF